MQQFVVGGAVRDALLGLRPKDIDFVWVGATCDDMTDLGFTQVGASFPVFLDPNGHEHALARTERKVGVGYHGFECVFDPSVTIVDDLERRDLTINSMAVPVDVWSKFLQSKDRMLVVDPFNGLADLDAGVLRHTSSAFAEDAVRVLRTARFAARYDTFTVDPSTIELMKAVVVEMNYVPQERIWVEFQKGLMENSPYNMIDTLHRCNAFDVKALAGYNCSTHELLRAVTADTPLYARAAWILSQPGYWTDKNYQAHCIPTEISTVSAAINRCSSSLINYCSYTSQERVHILDSLRAFSNPQLLDRVVSALELMTENHQLRESITQTHKDLESIRDQVDTTAIAAANAGDGHRIRIAIATARAFAILG